MTQLAFVHLSDLHYRRESDHDINIVLKALFKDLASLRDELRIEPDFVIFSGDLVHAGSVQEDFDSARGLFIDELMSRLDLETDRFFLGLGNHDIDVNEVKLEDDQKWDEERNDRDSINRLFDDLINDPDMIPYMSRFARFNQFRSELSSKYLDKSKANPFMVPYKVSKNDTLIGICCLNSCLKATGKDKDYDHGKLFLSERQVDWAEDAIEDCELRIAVAHHPITWLSLYEQCWVESRLAHVFDFVLFGHNHDAQPVYCTPLTGRALYSFSGAIFQGREYIGYNVIQCNLNTGKVFVHTRTYSDYNRKFKKATELSTEGEAEWKLHKRKAKPVVTGVIGEVDTGSQVRSGTHSLEVLINPVPQVEADGTVSFSVPPMVVLKTAMTQGKLRVFGRDEDRRLWHVWQDPYSPGGWTDWKCLGGTCSCIEVANNDDGRLEVFTRGADNKLYHIWEDKFSPTGWSVWHSLDGELQTDQIKVARNDDGRLEVFVIGMDGSLYHIWQQPGAGWSGWESLDGDGKIELFEVAQNDDGRLEIFIQRTDKTLWHKWQIKGVGWSGWARLGQVGQAD